MEIKLIHVKQMLDQFEVVLVLLMIFLLWVLSLVWKSCLLFELVKHFSFNAKILLAFWFKQKNVSNLKLHQQFKAILDCLYNWKFHEVEFNHQSLIKNFFNLAIYLFLGDSNKNEFAIALISFISLYELTQV